MLFQRLRFTVPTMAVHNSRRQVPRLRNLDIKQPGRRKTVHASNQRSELTSLSQLMNRQ